MLNADHIGWLQRLSGYDASLIAESVARVERLGLPHLSSELGRASGGDGYLAATMLCESIDWLAEHGVRPSRLKAKLKRPDVWPMWAEIRAAGLIAHLLDGVDGVHLDVPVGSGQKNADFGFQFGDGESGLLPVEFKALGLSYAEQTFCKNWASVLHSVEPPRGICTLHTDIDTAPPLINRKKRREMYRDAARRAKNLLPPFRAISGTVVVAHGSTEEYVRRMASTICAHVSQLPQSAEGWIALHWSNGAPSGVVRRAINQIDLPDHVAGIMLVGSAIVLDGTMHHVLSVIPRDGQDGEEWEFASKVGFDFGPIFRGFEVSAGVRPAVIRMPSDSRLQELIVRDGSETFWPFNLLLGPDPIGVDRGLKEDHRTPRTLGRPS